MLLGSHVAAHRRGSDESAVGAGNLFGRLCRESAARWRAHGAPHWNSVDRCRHDGRDLAGSCRRVEAFRTQLESTCRASYCGECCYSVDRSCYGRRDQPNTRSTAPTEFLAKWALLRRVLHGGADCVLADLPLSGVLLHHFLHSPARRQRVRVDARSEEHTSELQSWLLLVCRLLLEKK